jgi:hypothetical protein
MEIKNPLQVGCAGLVTYLISENAGVIRSQVRRKHNNMHNISPESSENETFSIAYRVEEARSR